MHNPNSNAAVCESVRKPRLIVTVDTEEEGLWGGRYPSHGNTVRNIQQIPRFQQLCDRLGIRPTYLVDAPVVEDDRAIAILREIADSEHSEIGAHLHPWCNPPLTEHKDSRESFMCNLPVVAQRAKIEWLTDRIEERFGRRPTSFRAGRYGLDDAGVQILVDLGYQVDSSVIPFTDYSRDGGPNFEHAPHRPYRVGRRLCEPDDDGELLEVPVSVGYNRRDFKAAQRWQNLLRRGPWRRLRLEGALDRTGMLQRIKLSPEQADAPRMNRLVDRLVEQGAPAVVMMFHSSSLLPGESPYVRTDDDFNEFLSRIEETCFHALQQCGLQSCTLSEFAEELTPSTRTQPLAEQRAFS